MSFLFHSLSHSIASSIDRADTTTAFSLNDSILSGPHLFFTEQIQKGNDIKIKIPNAKKNACSFASLPFYLPNYIKARYFVYLLLQEFYDTISKLTESHQTLLLTVEYQANALFGDHAENSPRITVEPL